MWIKKYDAGIVWSLCNSFIMEYVLAKQQVAKGRLTGNKSQVSHRFHSLTHQDSENEWKLKDLLQRGTCYILFLSKQNNVCNCVAKTSWDNTRLQVNNPGGGGGYLGVSWIGLLRLLFWV